MIQANELRIGNILNVAGNWWHVDSIISNGEKDYELYFKENDQYDHSANAKPIPLTPEVLERCGFECKKNFVGSIDCSHNEFDIDLRLNDDGGYSFFGSEFVHGVSNFYLHQLQNLYFALTGEELEIKL